MEEGGQCNFFWQIKAQFLGNEKSFKYELHLKLVWLNKNLNLHQVSLPISWENTTKSHKVLSNLPKCPTQSTLMRQKKKKILERSYSRLIFHTSRSTLWKKFPVCLQSSMKMEPKHFRAILMRSLALKNLQSHCFHSQDTSRIKTREARRESHLQETWSMKGFLADIHASVS